MLVLRILQRNHKRTATGSGPYISYYPYQLSSILEFELFTREEAFSGIEPSFRQKFNESVQILSNNSLITFDASQSNERDFQIPTTRGLAQDTSAPVIGITSAETFLQRIEAESGSLDAVAKDYLRESYQAADENLWLSSTFMLGAASERLIYVLADHVETILADPNASAELQGITKVRQRKEWIVKQFPAMKRRFPGHKEALIDVEDKFDTLYNTYRYLRNDAGHPRDTVYRPDPNQTKVVLLSFGLYAKAVNSILSIS